jgi:metal-responsive CopG/Arc/MetJ family transcriptional regulator
MARSNRSKRGKPAPAKHTPFAVRLPIALVNRIDVWAGKHDVRTRAEAIRRLVEIGLMAKAPRASKTGQRARAATLAGQQIDRMGDTSATAQERATRKLRLTDGPSVFRTARRDRPKAKIATD